MRKYSLEIIVFLSGAVVMIFELVGSRILAPYLGASLTVWTSLIGIILGSLSLGYYLGGILADKKPSYRFLSVILLVSSINIFLVTLFKESILNFMVSIFGGGENGAISSTLILFSTSSILLGMVSPIAVKLKMKDLANNAATVGALYAISTLGSIIGTFLAGFLLIPWLGTTKILLVLSLTLALTSLFAYLNLKTKSSYSSLLIIITTLGLLMGPKIQAGNRIDFDTGYSRIWINEETHGGTGRPIRAYKTEYYGLQSAMFTDNDDDLVFDYTKYYRLAPYFKPALKKALMIGGGAYSFPKDFLIKNPAGEIDVVEIDPGVTAMARKYFNLKDNQRLKIFHEDGRVFLNNLTTKYDAIYLDAFTSSVAIPFHLTTRETVQKIYDSLNEGGVIMANIISSIDGENGRFLRAEYATYKSIFPQVFILPVRDKDNSLQKQNIIFVAVKSDHTYDFKSENPEYNTYLSHLWTHKIASDMPILTDEYAPVESYVDAMLY